MAGRDDDDGAAAATTIYYPRSPGDYSAQTNMVFLVAFAVVALGLCWTSSPEFAWMAAFSIIGAVAFYVVVVANAPNSMKLQQAPLQQLQQRTHEPVVFTESFFADNPQVGQLVDHVYQFGARLVPDKLKYLLRNKRALSVLSSASTFLDKVTLIETVARVELFFRQYYAAVQEARRNGNKTLASVSTLRDMAASTRSHLMSLVHRMPPDMHAQVYRTADAVNSVMQQCIQRVNNMRVAFLRVM